MKNRSIYDGRFVGNRIVRYLFEWLKQAAPSSVMDAIANGRQSGCFTEEECREFYQLIGYSVVGYEEIFGDA